jgi:YD repeat-containing protein
VSAPKQTDFNNLVTEWEYDEFGRVTKETAPDGTELNTSYAFFNGQNATLLFTTVTTGTVIPPVEDYADGLGRTRLKRTKNRNDDWVAVRTDFDSRGRQYRSCQPYFPGNTPLWNTTTFDDNNRPLTITAATGKSMSYTYNGRTTTVTNTYTNQSSSKTVDADGLTVTATDAGGSINYTYNSFGQPHKRYRPRRHTHYQHL